MSLAETKRDPRQPSQAVVAIGHSQRVGGAFGFMHVTKSRQITAVEVGYNVIKGTEYFVSLQTIVVLIQEYNVMVSSTELTGTTEYLTLYRRCRRN